MQKTAENNIESCPLCKNRGKSFFKNIYYLCCECCAIFRPKNLYPSFENEKKRYEEHNNDINNIGYRQFVSPVLNAVLKEMSHYHIGLDFGAGTGPVISKLLQEKGYYIKQYDPFFHNFPDLLKEKYDFIVCCEVIEHFHDPKKEFILLKNLLKPNGSIFCMTHIYDESIDFSKWYYKNDFTHVFIYQKKTLEWIKNEINFSSLIIENRLIKFENHLSD